MKCSVEVCDRDASLRGWCKSHYARWYKHGDVGVTPIGIQYCLYCSAESSRKYCSERCRSRDRLDYNENEVLYCTFCKKSMTWTSRKKQYCNSYCLEQKRRVERVGLTVGEYWSYIEEHGNRCRICGSEDRLHLDHCHDSNKFRGMLCDTCNVMLGMAKDDPTILKAGADYLNQHRA